MFGLVNYYWTFRLSRTRGTGRAEQPGPGQVGAERSRGGHAMDVSSCSEVREAFKKKLTFVNSGFTPPPFLEKVDELFFLFLAPTGALGVKMSCVRAFVTFLK